MFVRFRLRWCRAFGALMLTLLSVGCGAYSTDPSYGYSFGAGWHHDWDDYHGWHHDWDDHHGWHRSS